MLGEEIGISQVFKVLQEGFLRSFDTPVIAVLVTPFFVRHSVFLCVCVANLPSSLRCEMHTLRTKEGGGDLGGECG